MGKRSRVRKKGKNLYGNMTKMFTKRIHVFRAGDQTSAQGVQRNFSEKDLQQVVDTYDPGVHEAPLVIGHQGDSDSLPSFGWIRGFARQGNNLYADVEFTSTAKDLVKDGHYRKVSISFYSPDSAINPNPGKWSARHLALLGAAPPAVKGLEPFSFTEKDGVFDYATALDPSEIFDEELGPTLMVDRSPLEMLKEKLESIRGDMKTAINEMQANQEKQPEDESSNPEVNTDDGNNEEDDTQKFTEIVQQTADLEDKFPEEQFMDHSNKISRKHARGAHGQVMQVVENVYEEQHGEVPEAFKKNIEKMKAKAKGASDEEHDAQHGEVPEAFKKNIEKMKAKAKGGDDDSSDHAEEEGRFETARSNTDSYGSRMKTGKSAGDAATGRMKTAASGEQDADRMNDAENGEQEADRKRTAKNSDDNNRFAGQPDSEDQIMNGDQYEVGESDYGVNKPKTASGSNPAGREDSMTKVPTETEETPDNTVFAVDCNNVMEDKNMRVLRQTSSQGRAAVKGGAINHAEPEFDETTSDMGVTTHKEKKCEKGQLSGNFEGDVAETVGPDGAFAECKGEKKSKEKQLTPGAMDEVDEADQTVGPDGAFAEDNLSGDFDGGPNQKTKKSGGVFAEEHGEKKNPYTKTGFGSTYGEDDDTDEDFNELSTDHACGGDMEYGMGSMGQAKPMGMETMYEELAALKKENERMKREYQEAKMNMRKEKMASFVEDLYESGKLTDGIMPQRDLQSYCEGLEFGTLEFAEGETPATKLLGLLNRLPNMVEYGEVVQGGSFQYSEEELDPHAKALRMVDESEGKLDYVECLKRAMYS